VNSFILEIFDDGFPYVTFYTVRKEGEEASETEKFARKFFQHELLGEDYDQIAYLLQLMGEEEGASDDFFTRHEDEASALPPKSVYFLDIPFHTNYLRLYCVKICDTIVVLFNGGEKSAQTAQESEDLQAKFSDAKRFARKIWAEIKDRQIEVDEARHCLKSFDGLQDEIIIY
jgi:hypothetical protein